MLVILFFSLIPWYCPRVKNWFNNRVSGLFFDALITFIDSTFLVIAIQGLLNVREVYYERLKVDKAFLCSIFALVILFAELIAISAFLR